MVKNRRRNIVDIRKRRRIKTRAYRSLRKIRQKKCFSLCNPQSSTAKIIKQRRKNAVGGWLKGNMDFHFGECGARTWKSAFAFLYLFIRLYLDMGKKPFSSLSHSLSFLLCILSIPYNIV